MTISKVEDTMSSALPIQLQPQVQMKSVGQTGISDIEVLALILRTGGDGESALQLAERILIHYGSMKQLALASFEDLCSIHNVGTAKAAAIKAAFEIRLRIRSIDKNTRLNSPDDIASLFLMEMGLLEKEELRVCIVDSRNHLMKIDTVYIGSVNTVVIRIGEVFREAIRINGSSIAIIHNHPSGDPRPSPNDVHFTNQIVETGRLLDIEVLDHIVIGDRCYISMKEKGLGGF